MRESNIENCSPWKILAILGVINLLLRLGFFNINSAEYTDGILQITLFENLNALWPPFYTILALLIKPIFGSVESAAKAVSLISSVALLVVIFFVAQRLFNRTTATYALLLYTISPDALRWSVRVMTDSLFAFLFFLALWIFLMFVETAAELVTRRRRLASAFIIISALATLTRYQGILLLPFVILVIFLALKREKASLPLLFLSLLLWVAVPLWIKLAGFMHTQQIAERTASSFFPTLLAYWNIFESFIAYFPYFLTYPIALLFLIGLLYTPLTTHQSATTTTARRIFIALFFYLMISILLLQSVFSSFQSRYLLPAIPFILIFAGYGLYDVEQKLQRRYRWLFTVILVFTLIYGMTFSLAVMVLQRRTFGDIKEAALFVRDNIPGNIPVYSNEIYKPGILCPKMRFWAGRDVEFYSGQPLPAGAIVCLHTAYGGSAMLDYLTINMVRRYKMREIGNFEADILPLLPDVMEEPISHQNPMAWVLRYQPQTTITSVYQIDEIRQPRTELKESPERKNPIKNSVLLF